jgi:putative FmdB family regulatory protein
MPTYDYRCPNGHDFEHFVRKISDAESERTCPVCGAVALRRVSGGAGLVFKGSGFYLTDYGKNAHRTSGPESKGPESNAGESKGDSKSESSGDAKSMNKSDGVKSESGASSASKTESSSGGAAKSESAKPTESKPSSGKTKGGDSK